MEEKETIYFVGIGGIGMSALAQLYHSQGKKVLGSDRGHSNVTKLLESKGIAVTVPHNRETLPEDTALLVYSDAVSYENETRVLGREKGINEMSYFEALGQATNSGTSIVIAGTHGKTTTTAMVAKILTELGIGDKAIKPTVIAGSILSEYGSNFIEGNGDFYVIEGCEYRRHFLHLHPNILVINNIELDHTDYYKDLDDIQDAFKSAIELLPENGVVVTNTESENIKPLLKQFDSQKKLLAFQHIDIPKLHAKGEFNKENARAAKTTVLALSGHPSEELIDKSLSNFKGTWRRFEYKGETKKGAIVYDDYAHHPTAVRGTIEMAKKEFSRKHLVVVFHPHLYSRTKDFFMEFTDALSLSDEVILLPIYAARETPDPSISSEKLVEAINSSGGNAQYAQDFDTLEELMNEYDEDTIILTMGAGDVYTVADNIVDF